MSDDENNGDEDESTVKDVDHSHPHTGETFESTGVHGRGKKHPDSATEAAEEDEEDDEDAPSAEGATDAEGETDAEANTDAQSETDGEDATSGEDEDAS